MYSVYVIECADGTYYTGITRELQRRIEQHDSGKGAKYTRGRGPVRLLAHSIAYDRSSAQKLEYYIKSLRRDKKVIMLELYEKERKASNSENFSLKDFLLLSECCHGKDSEIPSDSAS